MGHLNELQAKYFDKGLRIIGISNEPASKIRSVMIDELGAKYWMGSDPSRASRAPFGGGGIPHAYLVDASGRVVADMHPGSLRDAQIEALLKDVFDAALDRDLHKALQPLVKQYRKGNYGKVWTGAARYLEKEERALVADAQYLREKCEAVAAFRKKLIEDAIKGRSYAGALADMVEIARTFAGMEVVAWSKATEKELKADPGVSLELKAFKAVLKAKARELKAGGKAKKLGPVRTAYRRIVKKYAGTKAAAVAAKALERLGG